MKRKFLAVLACVPLILLSFTGCAPSSMLSFSNAFNGGMAPSSSHTERLVYTVQFDGDSTEYYGDQSNIKDLADVEFQTGEYVTEFKVLNDTSEIESDILETLPSTGSYYSIKTTFNIGIKVTIGENVYEHNDKITSTAYVAEAGHSFAPIYSLTESENLIISAGSTNASVALVATYFEVNYNKNEYVTTEKTATLIGNEINEKTLSFGEPIEKTYKYNFRNAIDNAEFLFALRGVKPEEKAAVSIPVVSVNYGEPKTLSVTNAGSAEKKIKIRYNGTEYEDTIKYDALNYRISSTNTAGLKQFILIQSEKSENIPYLALPIEYARAVVVYTTGYPTMGTLIFSLSEVEVSG